MLSELTLGRDWNNLFSIRFQFLEAKTNKFVYLTWVANKLPMAILPEGPTVYAGPGVLRAPICAYGNPPIQTTNHLS